MNIKELILELKTICHQENFNDISEARQILEKYSTNDWIPFIKFDDSTYKRNVVYSDSMFEVLIICWRPNQKSPVHAHPSKGCLMKMLSGKLLEKRNINKVTKESILAEGLISYMSNSIGTHQIINNHETNAISLHIYSPSGYYTKINKVVKIGEIKTCI